MPSQLTLPAASFSRELNLHFIRPDVVAEVKAAARGAGLALGDEYFFRHGSLVPLLARLGCIGGSWAPLGALVEWVASPALVTPEEDRDLCAVHVDVNLGGGIGPHRTWHAHGAFVLSFGGQRLVALGTHGRDARARLENGVALFAESREIIGELLRALAACEPVSRLRVWGGGLRNVDPAPVSGVDVILPSAVKADLLSWLDRFWRLRGHAVEQGLPLRRGLLLGRTRDRQDAFDPSFAHSRS